MGSPRRDHQQYNPAGLLRGHGSKERTLSGKHSIRGYLVQTIIALLDAIGEDNWDSVTLEPGHDSEKFDLLWNRPDGTTARRIAETR